MEIKSIEVVELKNLLDAGENIVIIDVRNQDEFEYCNLGAKLIPMSEILERYSEIPREGTVVVHCHHGGRSKKVIDWLQSNQGYSNLFNLAGGIHAWSIEIDSSVPIY